MYIIYRVIRKFSSDYDIIAQPPVKLQVITIYIFAYFTSYNTIKFKENYTYKNYN